MVRRAVLLACSLGMAACSTTPASFGITGPGTSPPATFKAPEATDDSTVRIPGIQDPNSPFSNSLKPAGDAATPGNFYGYN
jgi:hypothetical protein